MENSIESLKGLNNLHFIGQISVSIQLWARDELNV